MRAEVALLTSCIIPNTKTGPISNFSKKTRIKQLIENLNYLIKNRIFHEIYVIDPFVKNKKLSNEFENILLKNGLIESELKFLIFNPTQPTINKIKIKGKGYSEILMIIEAIKIIKRNKKSLLIHKISGRYKIKNLKKIIKHNLYAFNKDIDIVIPYCHLLSKCYTIMYSFRTEIDLDLFKKCLNIIDDKKHIYVEHAMYNYMIKKNIIISQRMKIFILLSPNMNGGSKQGKYNMFKQLINKIFYKYL